jgi:DNA-binding HxlR family transcriptional regulator
MDEKGFSDVVALLNGEYGLRILRYLSTGEWRIASDASRALGIHTTTASKFLGGMHRLGFLERRIRKSHARRTFEYHLAAPRITLTLELATGHEPIREALDFYLEYVSDVLAKTRRLGWPGIQAQFEARLSTSHSGLKEHLFTRILDGGGVRGMDELKTLFHRIHGEFLEIASGAMGAATARRILTGAADEAEKGREAVVQQHRLRAALEV